MSDPAFRPVARAPRGFQDRRARDLRAERARGAVETAAACLARAAAARERDQAQHHAAAVAVRVRDARALVEKLEADGARLAAEVDALLERAAQCERETTVVREQLVLVDRPALDEAAATAERERLEAALAEAREEIAVAADRERAIAAEIAEAREAVAALIAGRDGAVSRLGLLDADAQRAAETRTRMADELAALQAALADGEAALEAARERIARFDERGQTARDERDALAARAERIEAELRAARETESDSSRASQGSRLRLAEIDAELGMLAAQFALNPATADECADIESRYANEMADVAPELSRLRDELARLANVNLNAEAEIEEIAQRAAFLKEQLEDLTRARETLLASIAEIEESSQKQFNETFALVKTAFEDVYARLFPGGEARMWQTAPEELGETGIELSVAPPGKKMMALAALSGGERAMAASALIFALIRVKPSPFYLLDEVDAALDDANVERFSQFVRELGSQAQLLIVTHNKKTMELAERMYGVTMSEPGISRVIAADLTGAAADAHVGPEPALAR